MGWFNFRLNLRQAPLRWQNSVRILWGFSSTWVSVKEFKEELCFSFTSPQCTTIVLENLLYQIYRKIVFLQHPQRFQDIYLHDGFDNNMPAICLTNICHMYLVTTMTKIISNSGPEQLFRFADNQLRDPWGLQFVRKKRKKTWGLQFAREKTWGNKSKVAFKARNVSSRTSLQW